MAKFDVDTGGLIYPKAINQLFVGLYVMECYLVGLFLLVRDERNQVACIGQAVILIIITFLTAIYQALLNQAFKPLFRYLPVDLSVDKQPDVPTRNTSPIAWYSFFKKVYNELDDAVEEKNEQRADKQIEDNISMTMIQSKDLTAEPPVIWIPRDTLGLSKDAIEQTKKVSASVVISDENAGLGKRAAVYTYGDPPAIRGSSQIVLPSTGI